MSRIWAALTRWRQRRRHRRILERLTDTDRRHLRDVGRDVSRDLFQ